MTICPMLTQDSFDDINNLIVSLRQIEAERDELVVKCEALHVRENDLTDSLNRMQGTKSEEDSSVIKADLWATQVIGSIWIGQ